MRGDNLEFIIESRVYEYNFGMSGLVTRNLIPVTILNRNNRN